MAALHALGSLVGAVTLLLESKRYSKPAICHAARSNVDAISPRMLAKVGCQYHRVHIISHDLSCHATSPADSSHQLLFVSHAPGRTDKRRKRMAPEIMELWRRRVGDCMGFDASARASLQPLRVLIVDRKHGKVRYR